LLFRYFKYVIVCATYLLKSFFVGPVSKVWWWFIGIMSYFLFLCDWTIYATRHLPLTSRLICYQLYIWFYGVQKFGGDLFDGERMINIFPGDVITVVTNKNSYKCSSLVLTVGPWAKKILPTLGVHLPLRVSNRQFDITYLKYLKSNPTYSTFFFHIKFHLLNQTME
jgi:hypothetical protein